MGINYTKSQAVALRLLTENGRPVTLLKFSTSPDDLNKPWKGSTGLETLTVTAVFTDPVSEKDLGAAEIVMEGGHKSGKKIAFIAAGENLDANGAPIDLAEYDQLIDGGRTYKMEEIHTLAPGNIPLMYEVRLAR